MGRDVIIALDFATADRALEFLNLFEGTPVYVKVGMELFYAAGPDIIRQIKARGHKIFLDLKLHDIPNTVERAMSALSKLDVDMCNLHAAGTADMMRAALRGLTRADGTRPLLIAVTQLTSTSQERMERELLIDRPIDDVVMHYARNAMEAGWTAWSVRRWNPKKCMPHAGPQFLTVTPGVPLCGRRCGRPGSDCHAGARQRARFGLYRRRQADHGGGRSRCGLPPMRP